MEVFGKTLKELFMNAAEALGDILSSQVKSKKVLPAGRQVKVKSELKEKIKVKSVNLHILLVDFLNEILAKSQINKRVFKVKGLRLKENSLEAELISQKVEEFDEDVKAVTYHEVDIRQTTNDKRQKIWQTKLVFDI